MYVVASKCFRNHFISEKCKQYNNLTHVAFKIIQLCNYTLLTATVKVLETFLVVILWKPFQLLHRILYVSSITKAPSLQCWYQSREQVKISCSQVSVVTLFFAKKSWPTDRCAGALSWRRNQLLVLHFSGRFLLSASQSRLSMSVYIPFFAIAIPPTEMSTRCLSWREGGG